MLYLSNKVCVCTNFAQRTQLMCRLKEKRNFCRWTVHTFTVLSSDAVTNVCPSLQKFTLRTVPVWALNTLDSPLLKTHTQATEMTKYKIIKSEKENKTTGKLLNCFPSPDYDRVRAGWSDHQYQHGGKSHHDTLFWDTVRSSY